MTNHRGGSSLLQTPASDQAHRRHSHQDAHHLRDIAGADGHLHEHMHHHRQHNQHVRPNTQPEAETTVDQGRGRGRGQELRRRQAQPAADNVDSALTQIVQTVSVIHWVDGTGSTLQASTIVSPPLTELVDPSTGATLTPSPPVDILPSASSSAVVSPGSSPASYPSLSNSSTSTGSPEPTSTPSLSPSGMSSSSVNSSTFPSLSGAPNSTSTTTILPLNNNNNNNNNTTLSGFFFNSTSTTQTSLTTLTTSETSLTSSTTSTLDPKSTEVTNGGGAGGPFRTEGAPAPTGVSSVPPAETSQPPTPTSTIVGGVVGSICGVALLVFAVVFFLRWRKQQQTGHRRLGDTYTDATAPASRGTGFSGRMSQRGAPFAVPAALAALSGGSPKQIAAGSDKPETSERGFYRVSGRKLPSVLQHGGDGYTNPHDSRMSGGSDILYRDSQAFFGAPPTRLAVGSPMRPESGIAVMQPGPARTPVAGQSPLLAPSPTLSPPPPRLDAIGRSRPSADGSRVSVSRFTENMS